MDVPRLEALAQESVLLKRKKDETASRELYDSLLQENCKLLIEQCKETPEYVQLKEAVKSAKQTVEQLRQDIATRKRNFHRAGILSFIHEVVLT